MATKIWVNIGSGNGLMACCLMAPSHYLNQCWLIIKSSDIHIRAISQEMPQPTITKIRLKITYLKFHSNFPGANELKSRCPWLSIIYRQVSNIRRTKSKHLRDSCTVLRLSLPNPLNTDVKSRMKMLLEQRRQAMLQLHLSDRQFYCPLRCALY